MAKFSLTKWNEAFGVSFAAMVAAGIVTEDQREQVRNSQLASLQSEGLVSDGTRDHMPKSEAEETYFSAMAEAANGLCRDADKGNTATKGHLIADSGNLIRPVRYGVGTSNWLRFYANNPDPQTAKLPAVAAVTKAAKKLGYGSISEAVKARSGEKNKDQFAELVKACSEAAKAAITTDTK